MLFLCEWASDSFPSSCWRKGSAGLNWLSNSRRRPFTLAALSYFSWNINRWWCGGEKTQLLLPFHMSSPSGCCNAPPPQTNFLLAQWTQVSRILLPKPWKIVQNGQHYRLLLFFPCSFLIKPLPCTVSPKATEVESHHVLLWSTTFCFSRVFPLLK